MPTRTFRGQFARVDLSRRRISVEEVAEADLELFIGGRGLVAVTVFREIPPLCDPSGEENKLVFFTGPLAGTTAPGSSRYVVGTKSPLTNLYLVGSAGGYFGPELRRSNLDGIIIEGKANRPVYLFIHEGKVAIRPAEHLWGLTTGITQELIRREVRESKLAVCCIGPAGENLVPFSALISDRRAVGRGGVGAVMGAKNLKAIAVSDGHETGFASGKEFRDALRRAREDIRAMHLTLASYSSYGSATMVRPMGELGILPWRNWQVGHDPRFERISGEALREGYTIKNSFCAPPCPVRCSQMNLVRQGAMGGTFSEGPEYETLYAFGPCCDIDDPATIIEADYLCDEYGLDTISAGVTLAFAMECHEKGLLTKSDLGDLDLAFGNIRVVRQALHAITYRHGFGQLLSLGSQRMAAHIGQGSEGFAMHVKGMELGGYDPRGAKGMALVYACGSRGGCHYTGGYTIPAEALGGKCDRFEEKNKAELVKYTRDRRAAFYDAPAICSFVGAALTEETIAAMLNAVTDRAFTSSSLLVAGERINAVERCFNTRCGLTPNQDSLPRRLLEENLPEGPTRSQTVDLCTLRGEFYQTCGWDPVTGKALPAKLAELGLLDLVG